MTEHAGRTGSRAVDPMDWLVVADEALGSAFGVRPPTGFGYDFSGVVDELGEGVSGFAVGDRVFGGAMSRAVADHVLVDPGSDELLHTPGGVDDATAAGETAAAALDAIGLRDGDTVLIGGAAGGVGVRRPAGPAGRSAGGRHRLGRVVRLPAVAGR